MDNFACVRTDNMSGTYDGSKLVSAKFYADEKEAAIENGNVVLIGKLLEGEREVRKATAPTAKSALSACALVASPEVVKSKAHNTLAEFRNEAGDILRCYRFVSGNTFSVTKEAFSADTNLKVGAIVELGATTKFVAVASATDGSTQVGTVIAVEGEYYVIEVA